MDNNDIDSRLMDYWLQKIEDREIYIKNLQEFNKKVWNGQVVYEEVDHDQYEGKEMRYDENGDLCSIELMEYFED